MGSYDNDCRGRIHSTHAVGNQWVCGIVGRNECRPYKNPPHPNPLPQRGLLIPFSTGEGLGMRLLFLRFPYATGKTRFICYDDES
jgi:hypothetical protein